MMNDNFFRSSGSAIAIRRISQALVNVEYCVAGTGDRGPENLSWVPSGRYACFDLKTSNPFRLISELNRFRSWFKERGCSLVHCHHRRLAALLNAWGLPVLYTGQNAFPAEKWFRWLHPKYMTAITPSVAENILANTGTQTLAVIGNPADFPDEPPVVDLERVKSRAVCIARLDPVKGHKHLLAAWKMLFDRGYHCELHLVGEGPLREELEVQARRDGISHLVHFRGFQANVVEIVKTSLFAILASETEGQGIVTLEAASAGRASLLTAVPGSLDLLPPDRRLKNGIPYGDVPSLAEALGQWFASPEEVVREGQTFFSFLKQSSDARLIAERYEDLYRTFLKTYHGKQVATGLPLGEQAN
jgi:glycosyltransferase involved in cell wall biosynthesis